ncbi:sigma-54-dependent Fis family transcriptional regulator [Paenibacillus naphthalenovorans]|uniref:Fis family transcriptional regulator n=2 Tax=Paenibacillus naphthalenovorans TaxID=162209 RepID=A0A0U2L3Z4_9BACL|nr:sigma-54-dependent Fis family transcriptional regulator [Paenibacillus naphthalenovorans]ALS24642.1 Fis family transcriptional regulator [Paenibacillus naphthalenovorans]
MKIKILLLAPYRGLKELALSLASEQTDLDITVKEGDLEEALAIYKHLENEKFDIIISRGGTANLLRDHVPQPVVEIPLSGFDLLRTLTLVKDYKGKLEMVAFPNICDDVIAVSHLMGIDIPYTVIHEELQVEGIIRQAKKKGVQVIVGDTVTIRLAKKHGLQGVLITSGRESVIEAFHHAKQVYQVLLQANKKYRAYEALLHELEEGIAMADEQGRISFSNPGFRRFMQLFGEPGETANPSLVELFPDWMSMVQTVNENKKAISYVNIGGRQLQWTLGIFEEDRHRRLYYVRIKSLRDAEDELEIKYAQPPVHSFTQILGSAREGKKAIEQAKKAAAEHLITLYGEEGTGKKYIAGAIHGSLEPKNDWFIELTVKEGTPGALSRLTDALSGIENGTVYLKGLEKFDELSQAAISRWLERQPNKVIMSFKESPEVMLDKGAVGQELYELISKHSVYIPSLRERMEDLDEYIRYFIGKCNEKYGKQIVGIRNDVLERMSEYAWKGNLEELEQMVDSFVRISKGHYIENDVLSLIPSDTGKSASRSGTVEIDIHQTLEEIEQEIIQRVLAEEKMNQSRAAKRLGITRATLWRKLKETKNG